MNTLEEIAYIINDNLQTTVFDKAAFQSCLYHGIADMVTTTNPSGDLSEPVIVDTDGQCTELTLNDKDAMKIYHRVLNTSYSLPDGDIGKAGTYRKEIADMYIVAWGIRARLNGIRPEELAKAIAVGIPLNFSDAQLTTLGLSLLEIDLGSIETDSYKVYNAEFKGPKFAYSTDTIMCSIRYKVTSWIPTECYQICP